MASSVSGTFANGIPNLAGLDAAVLTAGGSVGDDGVDGPSGVRCAYAGPGVAGRMAALGS